MKSTLKVYVLMKINIKSYQNFIRRITPKRITSGGAHLRNLAPEQLHNYEETPQRWRAVGDTVSNLTRESNPRHPAPITMYGTSQRSQPDR